MHNKEKSELDEFWDIEKLLPKKKSVSSYSAHTYDTTPVEVILKAKESTSDNKMTTIEMRPADTGDSRLSFLNAKAESPEPSFEYSPDNPFIKTVKIYKKENFGYYTAFYEDGMKYLELSGEECAEPPFFSYVPQYSQLDSEQLRFYFYFRRELRKGRAIRASYSYILLYIFELINVEPNKKDALRLLCFVWQSYRSFFPKLDPLMREWITDFCLINRLSPSASLLGSAYQTAIDTAVLKELFICAGKNENEIYSDGELADALLRMCTNYDWRKSKYATGENISLYEKYIPKALGTVLKAMKASCGVFVGAGELKRDAFSGAICTANTKCRIEVSYCSIARSHEMRFLVSDVVKHTENRIRSYIGVKSKLTVYSLPVHIRKCIDEYMDSCLGGKGVKRIKEEVHEYDKLYDIPKREFSLESAKKIEESSWQTTQILVDAFEEEQTECTENISVNPSEEKPEADTSNLSDEERLLEALTEHMDFIKACLARDFRGQSEEARKKGRMLDSLSDEINEIAADIYGDIILERDGEFYTVIEDYKEVFE